MLMAGAPLLVIMNGCAVGSAQPDIPSTIPQTTINSESDGTASSGAPDDAALITESAQAGNVHGSSENAASTTNDIAPNPSATPRLNLSAPQRTGFLENDRLAEVSALAVAQKTPGVLFALNDSGNKPVLFAFNEQGSHLAQWSINERNRDWEDMTTATINGIPYLIIGDTGDNLKIHAQSALHFIEEPDLPAHANQQQSRSLTPEFSIHFTYEDGPRNVEAFAVHDSVIYLISKEPVSAAGTIASRLYELPLITGPSAGAGAGAGAGASVGPANSNGASASSAATKNPVVARFIGTLGKPRRSFESRLAASLTGVDLNHPTALDFDPSSNTAYLLSYRHVQRIQRAANQSWAEAFSAPAQRIHSHGLKQAEALAVSPGRAVWLTSERRPAPLIGIPIQPQL